MQYRRVDLDLAESEKAGQNIPEGYDGDDDVGGSAGRHIFGSRAVLDLLNDNLTKKQKCYIMLYYRDKLTMDEIAERMGVSKSTVSRTIKRGRENLLRGAKKRCIRQLLDC